MKKKHGLFIAYVLFIISLFLPWFTYNAKVMGYCWGTQYILYFLIPLAAVGAYLFCEQPGLVRILLAEFGSVMCIVLLVIVFGTWQEGRNIIAGFHWRDGFRTAQPAFWFAAACAVLVLVLLQFHIFFGNETVCCPKHKNKILIFDVVLLSLFILLIGVLNESKTKVMNTESLLYSHEIIQSAAEMVEDQINSWQGCKLYSIEYAGDDLCKEELSYCNSLNSTNTAFFQCIVFRTKFRSPLLRGGAWNPNRVYDWSWYLARTEEGNWELLTWGYP